MTGARAPATEVAAPRVTAALATALGLGLLAQGAFAGGLSGGDHMWLIWHEDVGDLLVVVPLASLVLGLVLRQREPEPWRVLALRAGLLLLVAAVLITGHAGGGWLAVHVPGAIAAMVLVARQAAVSVAAYKKVGGEAQSGRSMVDVAAGRQP